jgi:hypothetical protein
MGSAELIGMDPFYFRLARWVIPLFLIGLPIAGCLPKPEPRIGDFSVEIIDSKTGEPVPGVDVSFGDYRLRSDDKGCFFVVDLDPGTYQLRLERPWYQTQTYQVEYVGQPKRFSAALTPDENLSGALVYTVNNSNTSNRDIFRLDLASRSVTQLTDWASREANPARFTETKILFDSDRGSANGQKSIFSLEALFPGGKSELVYGGSSNDEHPSASDDGRVVAFKSGDQITIRRDGVLQTSFSGRGEPAVSPDGKKLAFIHGDYQLKVIISETDPGVFTRTIPVALPFERVNHPCWSPDSQRLAFDAWNTNGPRYIYVISLSEPSQYQRVTGDYRPGTADHQHPCWYRSKRATTDADLIFFSAPIAYSSRRDIYCVKVPQDSTEAQNNDWLMVSKGSGSKEQPAWVGPVSN